uniref:Uncharacterized protein n=1 Tax=Tanacetum cinerariifolium TaxID=118510 RepID=A0A6L2MB53_TANCI|nr:hypothetical protein [Tanacetum cinerariifolium]
MATLLTSIQRRIRRILEVDPADYLADGGDDDDDDSSDDDDDDDDDVETDEKEDEEHLAHSDSTAVASPAINHAPIPFPYEEEVAILLALQTPPPSPLTPLSSPLPQIPSPPTTQMRAAAPPTYHSLLPVGTPLLLPIPFPAPSTSRRAGILEADMSPRKGLLLTAPIPWYEVRESSAAGTARRSGSTVARRVKYSFVDTMETNVRAVERRAMTADIC